MSKNKNYIPQNSGEFDQFFKNLIRYLTQKLSPPRPEWKNIPTETLQQLNEAYKDWYISYEPTLKPHTKAATTARDLAKTRAEKIIRPFVKQYLHFPPVNDSDRVNMGIPNHDTIRTPHNTPAEIVEFFFQLKAIRQLVIHFKVPGIDSKAKPAGYDGAVLVWDLLDKAPQRVEDLKRHVLATRTPFTLSFDETERGKIAYVAMCWQNTKGQLGPWSEIQWTYVP